MPSCSPEGRVTSSQSPLLTSQDVITCSLQPLENTPLAPPSLGTLVGVLVPHIWVLVVDFCFPSVGLSHLSSGAALRLFSFNFYVLQNSLRILQSFWCLYLPVFTVLQLKLKLKYIKIQAMCFGCDSRSSGNDSRNWQSRLH